MLNFCDFIQVYVFTTNHHLNSNVYNLLSVVFVDAVCNNVLFSSLLFK